MISHPTNFAHVAHIGPEQTKPTLVDLSTVSVACNFPLNYQKRLTEIKCT